MTGGRHVPRVYVRQALHAPGEIRIEGDKAHHLRNVLRLGAGAPVVLFDGNGGEHDAHVTALGRGSVTLAVTGRRDAGRESPLHLELAQAIARGERMDFAIAKAVELGVQAIQPLFCARGQVKLEGARLEKKLGHWQRVAVSAAEQSGRERVPEVREPQRLPEWLPEAPGGEKLVLDPEAAAGPGDLPRANRACLLIGPESGFDDRELDAARAAGFTPIRLGPRVLRTETAGPAALAVLQSLWGDLG